MTGEDTVKITDFGTAKILQFGTAQTAHVMGTPSYMSPEQVKGKPVDGRSDIFSLGVILYELMTGEKPFPGQNITTVIYKIINEEPIPPRSLDSSIHPGLSEVITRALAKDPAARFQNCHELLDALKNYRDLVKPEATVRMAAVKTPPVEAGIRPAAQSIRPSLIPPANPADAPAQSSPSVAQTESKAPNKRVSVILSLILLGVIGYASYRVWPPLMDIWQHMHDPAEKPATPAKALSAMPAVAAETHESKQDQEIPASPTAPETTVPAAGQESAPPQPAAVKPSEHPADAAPVPVANTEKPTPAPKPEAPFVTPGANGLKATLSSELADISLADKVKISATGNTLMLTGQLTPHDHSKLLTLLHDVPGGVKVVDDIGYADETKQAPKNAEDGWVWIRSTPWGAKIFVDGTDTGLRTPARVEVPKGEHEIRLFRGGFGSARRSVLIQPGQNMQFTERLEVQ
jgi:Protein kinase domain/PEGA domain